MGMRKVEHNGLIMHFYLHTRKFAKQTTTIEKFIFLRFWVKARYGLAALIYLSDCPFFTRSPFLPSASPSVHPSVRLKLPAGSFCSAEPVWTKFERMLHYLRLSGFCFISIFPFCLATNTTGLIASNSRNLILAFSSHFLSVKSFFVGSFAKNSYCTQVRGGSRHF